MQNQQVLSRIDKLERDLEEIKKLLAGKTPQWGSDAGWIREVGEGEVQIRSKRFKTYKDAKGMIADLHRGI